MIVLFCMFIQIVITAFLWRAWSAMPVVQAENHGAVRVAIVIALEMKPTILRI